MSNKSIDLGKGSISKLLYTLAVPTIIGQLVNLLYNVIDRIFIGRMANGDIAMAGVGVAMPIILLVSAFAMLFAAGGAPLSAIEMGKQDNDKAEEIMSNCFSMLISGGIILTILFLVFKEPILWAFGASNATIGYGLDYLSIYLIGTIFVQISLGMNLFINTQGFTKIGMFTVIIGAIINIVLDPILIFGFGMGVKGAALATIISQGISAIFVLKFLFGKKSILKIRKKYLKLNKKLALSIVALGVAPFIMQATESLVLVSLNNQLLKYGGDLAVGAMTIMSSIMQVIMMPLMGLTQGAQPIISYNFGAKEMDRVKKTFKLLFIICVSYSAVMVSLIMIFPEFFVSIFNNKPELVEITSWAMKIYFVGMCLFGAQIACQQTFLALGQAKTSLIIAMLRKVVLLVPLIFILPMFIEDGLTAVLLAEPIADIIAIISTVIIFGLFYKKTFNNIDEKNNEVINNIN
ncbi:MAG: MATE family efflux transporter [Terrisporobacter othiniensis]|uniref:MATE family efflux transporter n=1 Tax=Terrisporobacter petrolearius TaxID=1460447 RepID=UPI0022E0E04A|nr:MATE family efflux transporter [Terrisporobacter petrolearius]MDU4862806.1 MATE family efflux transporter [Terrisporobacter othiniensis]MDU6995425.1 MATE family efflux transporter [Terrisporobacter othiniensis]